MFAIYPYRRQIAPNTMYSKRRKYLPVALRIEHWKAVVTRRGRFKLPRRSIFWPVVLYVLKRLMPGTALLGMIAAGAMVWHLGVPHLRVGYTSYDPSVSSIRYASCQYLGPRPMTITHSHRCPLILFRKNW